MIEQEVHGNILVARINRPEARNAVNGVVAQGLEDAVDRLESDDSLWVGVITGTADVFSAGADLKLLNAGKGAEMNTARGGFGGITQRARTKPLIAAVEGPALAGGLELALSCDLIVASRASIFGLPEVKRSLVAAAGGVHRLPVVLPRNVALEIGLTGDPMTAERAHQLGLVNAVAEPGAALAAALELAGRVTANAPVAVQRTLALMTELPKVDEGEAFKRAGRVIGELSATEDFREGLTAFIEKRPPQWKGK
jgi:enoyl-CoA hydratase